MNPVPKHWKKRGKRSMRPFSLSNTRQQQSSLSLSRTQKLLMHETNYRSIEISIQPSLGDCTWTGITQGMDDKRKKKTERHPTQDTCSEEMPNSTSTYLMQGAIDRVAPSASDKHVHAMVGRMNMLKIMVMSRKIPTTKHCKQYSWVNWRAYGDRTMVIITVVEFMTKPNWIPTKKVYIIWMQFLIEKIDSHTWSTSLVWCVHDIL